MSKIWGLFLVAQDMVLSHRAKFQLIINIFRSVCILSYFYRTRSVSEEKTHQFDLFDWLSNLKNLAILNGSKNVKNTIQILLK